MRTRTVVLGVIAATAGGCGGSTSAPPAGGGPFRETLDSVEQAWRANGISMTRDHGTPSGGHSREPLPTVVAGYHSRKGSRVSVLVYRSPQVALRARAGQPNSRLVDNLVVVVRHRGDDITRILRALNALRR